jgi:hypothetical protein
MKSKELRGEVSKLRGELRAKLKRAEKRGAPPAMLQQIRRQGEAKIAALNDREHNRTLAKSVRTVSGGLPGLGKRR